MEYFPDAARLGQTPIKPHILIVEDEELFAKAISKRLARAGYDSQLAPDLASARRAVEARIPDLVLLDMRLPDGSGLDWLADLRERYSALISVLMFSAYAELEDAVSAMKLKAEDYLKKPIDLDELLGAIERILNKKKLAQQLEYSRTREQHAISEVELLGKAPEMAQIRAQINRIAALCGSVQAIPPTVLVLGETGTGKDVVARLLHRASGRAGRPFVQVDCAALPRDLIEAELFGHEKGAFTHAHSARTGLIEAAEDGVLFLDEIVELPLNLQAKLLAVLERRSVRALGSNRERPVAAWFIAATNRDPQEMVRRGQLRSDLYFRLNVMSLHLHPLHARGQDVVLLARHFLERTAKRYGLGRLSLSGSARDALLRYSWPGNVREIKHLIERAALLSCGGEITEESLMLPRSLPESAIGVPSEPWQQMTLDQAEQLLIERALQRCGHNVSEAARQLGVTRMAMRYRMKKYGLAREGGE